MLDEFDVPNVGEAVEAACDDATTTSWERIKTELLESQTTVAQQPQLAIVELFNRWLLTVCKSELECNTVKSFCEYVQQQQAVQ